MIRSFVLLGVCAFLSGCPGFGDRTLEELSGPLEAPPSWDDPVETILLSECASCHTDPPQNFAPSGFRLDKYTTDDIDDGGLMGAFEMRARIQARAVDQQPGPMPPGNGVSDNLKVILDEWIASGAPRSLEATQ